MAYKVIILYRLYMPSYVLGTFTEYPYLYYKLNRHFHAIPKVLTEEKDRKKALKYSKILS